MQESETLFAGYLLVVVVVVVLTVGLVAIQEGDVFTVTNFYKNNLYKF